MFQKFKHIYETKYKFLLLIPILMIILALVQIGAQYATTGDFVNKGISLKGGSTITITEFQGLDNTLLAATLSSSFPDSEITVRALTSAGKQTAISIDSGIQEKEQITEVQNILKNSFQLSEKDYSVEVIGSSLGDAFFSQTIRALLVAFLLMGIVVFFYFRKVIPSLAVISAAFSDIIITLAIFNLTGMKLSTAGVAAFLMLIGYSVDTDMLLTTRVLKRVEGSVMERVYGAIKTGSTMLVTTLIAVSVTALLVQSDVIKQIMIILIIGLLVDFIITWIQNVGLLRWYLERKKQ